MHHTRSTHNSHNETQRRLKKIKEHAYWFAARTKKHGDEVFLTERRESSRELKKFANKAFRKNKDVGYEKIVNRKILNYVFESWD